jgi:hypothetical protein
VPSSVLREDLALERRVIRHDHPVTLGVGHDAAAQRVDVRSPFSGRVLAFASVNRLKVLVLDETLSPVSRSADAKDAVYLEPRISPDPLARSRAGPFEHLERPRLADRLAAADTAQITVVAGPAGAGKSELLRALHSDPSTLFFRVGREHASFARFVHGLARTVARVAPGAQA